MLRFLTPRPQVDPVYDRLLEVVEQHRAKSKTRKACKVPAWAKWPMDKKLEAVKFYSQHGYRALQLKYSQTPPSSTVRYALYYCNPYLCTFSSSFSCRTWLDQLQLRGTIRPAGRPRWLDCVEEKAVLEAALSLRQWYET